MVFEVVLYGSRFVRVINKETPDVDFDEAVFAPTPSRRKFMREMKKPDVLALYATTYKENGSRDDTFAADDEQDVLASDCKTALVMAALRGDALADTV